MISAALKKIDQSQRNWIQIILHSHDHNVKWCHISHTGQDDD